MSSLGSSLLVVHHSARSTAAAALAIAVCAQCVTALQSRSAAQSDSVLANGLRVTVVENHDAPLATVLLAVRTGSFTQRPGEEGLAHLYEHVLFRSYGRDASDFAEEAGKLNAWYNGTTGTDIVKYFLVLPSEGTERAIRLLSRLVSDARFGDRHIEEELPVVLDELAQRQSDPTDALSRRVGQALWGQDWYRFDVSGDSVALQGITADRLQQHFDRYYVPNNSVLIVTGDAHAETVFEHAAEHFEDWDRRGDPFAGVEPEPIEPLPGTTAVLHADEVLEATIEIQVRAPGTADDVEAVRGIEALVELLNEPSGALQTSLVTNGPLLVLRADLGVTRLASTIVLRATASLNDVQDAVMQLSSALDQIDFAVQPVDSGEADLHGVVATMAKRWELDLALTTEQTARIAPYLADLWARGEGDYLYDRSPFADELTQADFIRIAVDYVRERPKAIGVLAPTVVIEQLQQRLGGGLR